MKEGSEGGGGEYSYFPAQILIKFYCPSAKILSSQCVSCTCLSPFPIVFSWKIPVSVHWDIPYSQLSEKLFPARSSNFTSTNKQILQTTRHLKHNHMQK